jgi:hypothetical protein
MDAAIGLNPAHEHYSVFEKYNQEHLRDMAVIDQLRDSDSVDCIMLN